MALEMAVLIGHVMTAKDIAGCIIELLQEEGTWIRQVADAHRRSAMQAIRAAQKGNREQHMRVALGHLRDVYNLLAGIAARKPTPYEWFHEEFFGVDSPRYHRVTEIAEEMIGVAVLISKEHWNLGEKESARDWAKMALESFSLYERYERAKPTTRVVGIGEGIARDEVPGLREQREKDIHARKLRLKRALSGQL